MPEKVEILVELKNDSDVRRRLRELQDICDKLNKGIDININGSGLNALNSQISGMRGNISSLQSALHGLGSFSSTIGGALTSIGNLFKFDLMGTVERTLTAYGTILATQGMKSAVTRYDIMSTYGDYMEIMGVSAEKADESLERVNQAIQGIPVGLDTAAQEIRLFTMYLQGTGDSMDEVADKATNLTIGLERALVAGGASEAMKTTAKYEVQRLLAVGELGTKRQWMALLNGLGVSGQYLKDVMGYGDMDTQEFISQLTSKKIPTEAFIQGLADLADYEGLNKAIDVYKTTIEAGMYDIKFAVTRGFADTFKAINETLEKETGKGIRDYMQDIRNGINDVFKNAQEWIREHPEALTTFLDKFNDIMQRAKDLDIGHVMSNIVTEGGKMIDFFVKLYDALPEGWFEKLFVFSSVWAGPLGRMFLGLGSIFRYLGSFVGLLSKLPLIGKLFSLFSFGGAGTAISGKSILGALGGIGTVAGIGGVIFEYAKIMESIGKMNFGNWEENIKAVLGFVTSMGTVTAGLIAIGAELTYLGAPVVAGELLTGGFELLLAGAGGVIFEFAKVAETISSLDLSNFDTNMAKIDGVIKKIAKFVVGSTAATGVVTAATGGWGGLFIAIGEALTAGMIGDMDLAIDAINRCGEMAEAVSSLDIADDVEDKVERLGKMLYGLYEVVSGEGLTDETLNSSGYAAGFMQNMATALEEMSGAAESLSLIEGKLNWLNRSEGKFDEIKTKVEEFAEGIGDIYKAFTTGFGPSWTAKKASENYAETLGNMNAAMTELQGLTDAMSNMEHLIDTLHLGLAGNEEITKSTVKTQGQGFSVEYESEERSWATDTFQKYTTRIREFLEGVDGIVDVLGQGFVSAKLEQWESSAQATALTNMGLALDAIAGLHEKLATFHESFDWDTSSRGITNILQISKSLFDMFGTDAFQNWGNMTNAPQLAQNFQNVALAFGGEDGEGGILRIAKSLQGVGVPIMAVEANDITGRLKAMLESLKEAVDVVGEDDGEDVLRKSIFIERAVKRISDMITSLNSVKDNVTALTDGDISTKIGEMLNTMFSSFDTESAESFSEKVTTLGTVIGEVKGLFAELAETSLENLNGQAESLVGHLKDLNSELDDASEKMGDAKQQAAYLAANIQSVGVMASMARGHISSFASELSNTISSCSALEAAVANLVAVLNSIPRTIPITITANVGAITTAAAGAAAGARRFAAGLAGGGPARGTDIIPAMLSPGEFVMRAGAVKAFGEQFMRNINSLNIAGAVSALAKNYAINMPNGANYVTNYDNHASVNQTIYTNNPDYSYRRASRYVRALR